MEKEIEKSTEEVAEVTPVVDEIKADETVVVEDKPTEEIKEEEGKGFDPSAFAEVVPEKVEDEVAKKEDEVDGDEGGSGEIDWVTDEEEEKKKEEEVVAPIVKVDGEDPLKKEEEAPVVSDAWKGVVSDLGLDADKFETIEQFKEHLVTVENENNELRNASGSNATSESITRLEALKGKDNTELVKLSLEKDGFEGQDLDDAVDKYIDNGMIDIEAQKIRKTIDNAIVNEQNKVTQSTVDAEAKQQQEHEESVKALEEHVGKTDTMFGFKMSKDEEGLEKVQKAHVKYITSGSFMNDVFKNEESVSEVAWFTRNKEVIMKAMANRSLQQGKDAILNDIREPEVVGTQRFRDPSGKSEFDPKKFGAEKN